MPCRSQEEEEDPEWVEVDRCLLGSSLGWREARARGTGCGEAWWKGNRCSWMLGRRALLTTVHSHGRCFRALRLSPTSLSPNPGSQPCHSCWGPSGPCTGACSLWSPVLPRPGLQLSARPGWALLPGRARCRPCPQHILSSGVWIPAALASQSLRQPLVQRPGCAPRARPAPVFQASVAWGKCEPGRLVKPPGQPLLCWRPGSYRWMHHLRAQEPSVYLFTYLCSYCFIYV
jgi:hypothetical protein